MVYSAFPKQPLGQRLPCRLRLKWREVKSLSRVRLFATRWTVAHQAPPSIGFSRQEYWSELPFPSPGNLPDPGIEPRSPALQADTLTSETVKNPGWDWKSLNCHWLGLPLMPSWRLLFCEYLLGQSKNSWHLVFITISAQPPHLQEVSTSNPSVHSNR